MKIETLGPDVTAEDCAALAEVLTECVEGGASLGFMSPVPRAEVETYWKKVTAELAGGARTILVVREADGKIIGTAQLAAETRANGRHRAEVQKVLVRPTHRRRGLARRLMAEVEARARTRGITLLFLDTSEGRSGAQALYEQLGYTYAGGIPGYALDPDGTPAKNAIYFKNLRADL
ncbi:MAG: GNAT family N-acetyltransferase [Verrucomicrobia bacterium]|nr:GNAT family N-acetyltransferase [Verrucomicrobiota bacterium]